MGETGDKQGDPGRELPRGRVQRAEEASEHEGVVVGVVSLKKTILMYLAVQISEKEIEDLRKIFVKLDNDGNGMISRE